MQLNIIEEKILRKESKKKKKEKSEKKKERIEWVIYTGQ